MTITIVHEEPVPFREVDITNQDSANEKVTEIKHLNNLRNNESIPCVTPFIKLKENNHIEFLQQLNLEYTYKKIDKERRLEKKQVNWATNVKISKKSKKLKKACGVMKKNLLKKKKMCFLQYRGKWFKEYRLW